jgi:hypothetical protein
VKGKGYHLAKKKPERSCPTCKNRGHFVAINENGYKFMFDCPEFCEWNTYRHGKGKKNPWKKSLREKGFKLEHEVRGKIENLEVVKKSIQLGVVELCKGAFKGTGFDSLIEDFQKGKGKPKRSSELQPASEILNAKAEGSDELPF